MSAECIACQNPVRARQQGLQCDGCFRWQHRTCGTGISQCDYRYAVQTGAFIDWRCVTCLSMSHERCWRYHSYQRKKSVRCLTASRAKLLSPCSPSLSTCPVTGSTAPPGALQIGPCLRKQWGPIMTSKGGTMASTAEPQVVDSRPCTSLFSYCTKRPNLPPCRSVLFQIGNSKESKGASTVTSRRNCLTCGMNTRPTRGQPSGCWKPAPTWTHRGNRRINRANKKNGSFRSHQIK